MRYHVYSEMFFLSNKVAATQGEGNRALQGPIDAAPDYETHLYLN